MRNDISFLTFIFTHVNLHHGMEERRSLWFKSVMHKRIKGGRKITWAMSAREHRRGKIGIKYVAVQIRMRGGGGKRWGDAEPLALSLFCQPSSYHGSLPFSLSLLWPTCFDIPPATIWHFLLAISLLPNFLHTCFPDKSLFWLLLGSPSHFTWQFLPFHCSVAVLTGPACLGTNALMSAHWWTDKCAQTCLATLTSKCVRTVRLRQCVQREGPDLEK